MPIPLHETRAVPNPDAMFPTAAPWVLFSIWAGYEKNTEFHTPSRIQAADASASTITRDEVPNLN